MTDKQKDELALLVAERSVVCESAAKDVESIYHSSPTVFRDQELSPQEQQSLGLYLGDGEIERHPQAPQVPGVGGGVSLIWEQGRRDKIHRQRSHRVPYGGGQFGWHTDLVHEAYPPGYTHLHQDTVPAVGEETSWSM